MSKKLLLADDSITIQKVIGITFAHQDFDLTIVDNGDVALQKAQADKPQLIMADVFMPGKNGYELCAAVKQDPNLQDVPVLLLTGTFEPFDEEKAISSGANGWISKPFESQTLVDKVEELIGGAPAAAPAQPAAPTPPVQPAAPVEPAAPVSAEPDNWGDVSFDETPATPAPASEPPVFEDDSVFIIDDGAIADETESADVWADTGAPIELAEPDVMAVDPAPAAPEPPAAPVPPTPPVQPAAPTPPPVEPAAPAPPTPPAAPVAPAADPAAQVAGMSEADLQQVVERVAGAILEKVAWEVVPDLAENLIKDEIRKLKDGA